MDKERLISPGDSYRPVAIGRIRRAVGLDGRLEVELYSGDIGRLAEGTSLLMGGRRIAIVKSSPGRKKLFSLYLEGISDRDAAEQLRGLEIEVPEEELPPPPDGTYYHYQLIGSSVVDQSGGRIGTLSGIMETGSNDVYVVESDDGHEILVPATRKAIVGVDTLNRVVTVDLQPGPESGTGEDAQD